MQDSEASVTYQSYLHLDTLLSLQVPRSEGPEHVLTRGGAIVCGNHFSLPRPILTTGLMPRSDVRAPSRLPIPKLQFPDAGIWELGVG